MSDDRVVSLNGEPVIAPGVNDRVVAVLEDYLERARNGDVAGIALAVTYGDGSSSFQLVGKYGYSMLGAVTVAQAEMAASYSDG
ncbi:MAG: hypothetical protein ACPG4X_16535 [Pikeienuella sp.]